MSGPDRTLVVAYDHPAAQEWCEEREVHPSSVKVVVTDSPLPYELVGVGTVHVAFADGWDQGRHAVQIADVVRTHKAIWGEPTESATIQYATEGVETR